MKEEESKKRSHIATSHMKKWISLLLKIVILLYRVFGCDNSNGKVFILFYTILAVF